MPGSVPTLATRRLQAFGKSGLRMLGQFLASELHPKGIHVVYVIVDGQIDAPKLCAREPDRNRDTVIFPGAIVDAVISCLKRRRSAWLWELDIRPAVETF